MVREPDGLGGGVGAVLAGPGGSRQVPEVVAYLEGDHHVCVVLSLRDHFDEEAKFVGLPEGDDAEGGSERGVKRSPRRPDPSLRGADLLWVVLEVLRFRQFIILGSSIFSSQDQFLGGYDNLRKNNKKTTLMKK